MAQELTDIDGLGSKSASKLGRAGIESIQDLARCNPEDVAEDVPRTSSSRIETWQRKAERDAIVIKTGEDVAQEYEDLTMVSTGIDKLDNVLNGGWESGFMVAMAGETGSGKTQISFQSLGQAVKNNDGVGIYIETERGRYRGNRLRQMFDKDVQSQVHKIEAYSLDQQEMAYEKLLNSYNADNLAFVVVDSFTARFRMSDRFTGREDLPNRSTVMSRHLDKLDRLAATCDTPIILTCQIAANPDSYGANQTIYGGSLMHHMVNFVIFMKARKGALSQLEIRNHPEVENQEFQIQITEDGVGTP